MGNSKNTETDLQWTKAATSLRANHFGRPRSVIAQRNKFKTNAMRHIHFQLTLTKWFFILVALLMFQIFNRKPLKIPTIAGGFNQRMCNYLKILRIINCVFHLESYFYQALNQLDFFLSNFNRNMEFLWKQNETIMRYSRILNICLSWIFDFGWHTGVTTNKNANLQFHIWIFYQIEMSRTKIWGDEIIWKIFIVNLNLACNKMGIICNKSN